MSRRILSRCSSGWCWYFASEEARLPIAAIACVHAVLYSRGGLKIFDDS
jgi:hypothetical protein